MEFRKWDVLLYFCRFLVLFRNRKFSDHIFSLILCFINCEITKIYQGFLDPKIYIFKSILRLNYFP